MSISGNAISLNRQLVLIFSLPFCWPGCRCNVRIWCGFLGTWATCGNQEGTVQDNRQKCPDLLTFGEAKLHAMAELSVFKQSRKIVYVSFVLLWLESLCFCFVYRVSYSPGRLPTCNVEDDLEFLDFWSSCLYPSTEIIDAYYHAWVMKLWGLCPGLLVC